MTNQLRIRELLSEMRQRAGSVPRLANVAGVSERAMRQWLNNPSEDDLHRLRQDSIDQILRAARDLGLEPLCFATGPSLWDVEKSYEENLRASIQCAPAVTRPFADHERVFLGYPVRFPFGASASVITSNSLRLRFLAGAGACINTYKTVRSRPYKGHPTPNIFFCTPDARLLDPSEDSESPLTVFDARRDQCPTNGMMNRYSMPSLSPEAWETDFRAAQSCTKPGELLILSVVGTADPSDPEEVLLADFAAVVELALKAGASVIELNLSCPNCTGREGALHHNLPAVLRICRQLKGLVGKAKLILKIGYMGHTELRSFVLETAAYVHAYAAINTYPVEGLREGEHGFVPAFGTPGLKAGVSGTPIFRYGLSCVRNLDAIRQEHGLRGIGIIGIGGVASPPDVKSYLDAGADVVQATTAFFVDSYFALKVQKFLSAGLPAAGISTQEANDIARVNWSRAVQESESEFGANESLLQMVESAAMAEFLQWQREFNTTVSLGPQRGLEVPTVTEFKLRIRKRMGRR